jgi:DNA-nicking Smr family endonuclease
MRRLSPEEHALWKRVAGSARPINPPRNGEAIPEAVEGAVKHRFSATAAPPSGARPVTSAFRGGSGNANTLDGSWDKRIATGRVEPDFTIDLHGETLSSAHARLNRSLSAALRHEARVILLITGKPAADNPRLPPTSRGVIRASVKDWLAASPHSAHIAAIRGAHPRHGGAGALYVILRRGR